MSARSPIADHLVELLGPDNVVTDEQELRASSIDRYRKYQDVHGVYVLPPPVAIAYARTTADVAAVLSYADAHGINVVPRTGRSATEGGLETAVERSIVLDGSRMNRILHIDPDNMQVTVECGVRLQDLEDELRPLGLTTGHSPQSKPLAQMGGLTATRSIGQLSTLYGGIEDMVIGLEAVFPDGTVTRIKNVPRRAAGPDIRHLVIGNEGALCYITEVTVKLFRFTPETTRFLGYRLASMATGFSVLREVMVTGLRPAVMRLYDEDDAQGHFAPVAQGQCVMVFSAEGHQRLVDATIATIEEIVAAHPEVEPLDPAYFQHWFDHLNWGEEQIRQEREEILQTSEIGFTTEVSGSWSIIHDIYRSTVDRVRAEIGALTWIGGHSSHSYQTGTNVYFTYYYKVDCAPEDEVATYHKPINRIICEQALALGGSIVHHHGIGKARTPWTEAEHGSAYHLLHTLKAAFDPHGVMNAGTIFPLEENPS
ncbi:FAD-binding oxidoreductase [Propioniciclava coleopterorum]|uniref:FAD-binding oxidoreductase n=1 Tax=Propioniciclava coleopterorum TaxID=2714937 RepID=A0A6G7Y2W6_9ACTN|nr:FAD-binding oxidoreductase [Propioniciclava coleopterorum]QIK70988.1 FAD-binding oxidoreductase [Propioniciclava coleopterorum]